MKTKKKSLNKYSPSARQQGKRIDVLHDDTSFCGNCNSFLNGVPTGWDGVRFGAGRRSAICVVSGGC